MAVPPDSMQYPIDKSLKSQIDPDKSKVTKLVTDYGVTQHIYSGGGLMRLAFNDRSGYYPRQIDGKSVSWPHGEWKREEKPKKFTDRYWNGHTPPKLEYDVVYEVDWRKFNDIGIKETMTQHWTFSSDYKKIQTTFVFRNLPTGVFARVVLTAFEGCTVTTFTNAVGQPLPQWTVTRGHSHGGVFRPISREGHKDVDINKTREDWERKRSAYLEKPKKLSKVELEEREKDFDYWTEKDKEEQFVCFQNILKKDVCFGEVRETDNPGNEMFVYLEGSCLILSTLRMPQTMVMEVARKAELEVAKKSKGK